MSDIRTMGTVEAALELTKAYMQNRDCTGNDVTYWFAHFHHAVALSQLGPKNTTTLFAEAAAKQFASETSPKK